MDSTDHTCNERLSRALLLIAAPRTNLLQLTSGNGGFRIISCIMGYGEPVLGACTLGNLQTAKPVLRPLGTRDFFGSSSEPAAPSNMCWRGQGEGKQTIEDNEKMNEQTVQTEPGNAGASCWVPQLHAWRAGGSSAGIWGSVGTGRAGPGDLRKRLERVQG